LEESEGGISGGIAIKGNLKKNENSKPQPRLLGFMLYAEGENILVDQWTGNLLYTKMNNYTIENPNPEITCYQVNAFYDTQQNSEKAEDCLGDSSGIEDILNNKDAFQIYPNPTDSYIKIDGESAKLTLMNVGGAVVLTSVGNEIDLSPLASGIYLLKIETENGSVIKKVIRK